MLSNLSVHPLPLFFAILGAVSGIVTTAILQISPYWYYSIAAEMHIGLWPPTVVPGLVFGTLVGLVLLQRRWASPASFVAFIAAATACNYCAVSFAQWLVDMIGSRWITGIAGGLVGSAGLTACTMILVPLARGRKPFMLTVAAGGLLGALLAPALAAESLVPVFVFYGAWQAGYAASLATALPRR